MFAGLIHEVREQKEEAEKLREQLQQANDEILQANGEAASRLTITLEEEKAATEANREALFNNIEALINASAENQEARLTAKITQVKDEISGSKKLFAEADSVYRTGMNTWSQKQDDIVRQVGDKKDELKARMVDDWDVSINISIFILDAP
jgi:kinesin family member 11